MNDKLTLEQLEDEKVMLRQRLDDAFYKFKESTGGIVPKISFVVIETHVKDFLVTVKHEFRVEVVI